jgi:peptide-methionine (R)-S-oxide reductase
MKFTLPILIASIALASCAGAQQPPLKIKVQSQPPVRKDKVVKTDAEWKKILTPVQYEILRSKGTEAAFCGKFHDHKQAGIYVCAGCKLPLFSSAHKFDSGTGWPSFYRPVEFENVWYRNDTSHGMNRIEILCARCDGHLGHAFDDGPRPTGWRYCLNSDAMLFEPRK